MDCEQYTELMSAALDGELTAAQRRALEDHLAVCPACAALWDSLRAQSAALRGLDCPVPEGLKGSILHDLPPQELPRPAYWKRWAAACACLVIVLGAVVAGGAFRGATSANTAPNAGAVDHEASSGPMEIAPSAGVNEIGQDYYWISGEPESPSALPAAVCPLAPGAIPEGITVLDSREALVQFLAPLPAEAREALAQTYGDSYFARAALAAVVVSAAGEPQLRSLSEDRAVLTLSGSPDDTPSLWLLLAEVGTGFRPSEAFETVTEP